MLPRTDKIYQRGRANVPRTRPRFVGFVREKDNGRGDPIPIVLHTVATVSSAPFASARAKKIGPISPRSSSSSREVLVAREQGALFTARTLTFNDLSIDSKRPKRGRA